LVCLAAIRYAHRLASVPSPTEVEVVRAVIRGIRRTIGTTKEPKAPATNDRLRRAMDDAFMPRPLDEHIIRAFSPEMSVTTVKELSSA
jgi:hypothetical protein